MDPIRIAFIGGGDIAVRQARGLLETQEVEVVGVADPNPQCLVAQKAPELFPGGPPPFFADHRAMLDALKDRVTAVGVFSPHNLHAGQVIEALDRGLDVFCEKPMTITLADARNVAAKVAEKKKVFLLAYPGACSKNHLVARGLLRSRILGQVQMMTGVASQSWRHYAVDTWRGDPALAAGGFLHDTGSHLINSMLWLKEQPATEVTALLDMDGTRVEIQASVAIRFADGTLGSIAVHGNGVPFRANVTLIGTEGSFELFAYGGDLTYVTQKERRNVDLGLPLGAARAFVELMRRRLDNPCPVDAGVRVAEVFEAVRRSATERRTIKIAELA